MDPLGLKSLKNLNKIHLHIIKKHNFPKKNGLERKSKNTWLALK